MGLFKKKETRDNVVVDENSVDVKLLQSLGISTGRITFKQAMEIPAVCSSVDFIASICARVPVVLYRENGEDTEAVKDDKRVKLLNDETGDLLNAYQMKKAWVTDYFDGRGYIYINNSGATVQSLNYVEKSHINVCKNTDPIFKDADILIDGRRYFPFEFLRLCRNTKDGVDGESIVETNNRILALYYDTIKYEQEQMATGGGKSGFLKSPRRISEPGLSTLREKWDEFRKGRGSRMMILNDGMEFQETSETSTEMQMNENKQANANDITMIFGLSSQALQGANDDEIVSAVKTAVMPIIEQMEAAYNDTLLLESEKDTMYFACDTSKVERGDILKRYQAYQIALASNFMQPDEIRYKEDLPSLGLDFIKLGLNDVLYNPKTKEIYTPNTNQTANMGNSDLPSDDEIRSKDDYIRGAKGRFAGRRGHGGGSVSSGVDKSGKSGIIKEEISKNNIKLEINPEKQSRHIKGSPEYIDGRSYLTISEDKVQKIINEKSGTGLLVYDRNGLWKHKELIDCNEVIGVDINKSTMEETSTDKGTIHYSKSGTHLVPRKEKKT